MAISNLYPAEGPTLNLSFANSRKLDRRITFTRTTGGTYMDSDGLIKYALPDCARFGHHYVNGQIESLGLLIEEQGENIFPRSENFTAGAGWGGGGTINLDSSIFDPRGNTGTVYYPTVSEWTRNFNGGGVTFLTLSFFTKRNAINGGDSTRIQMYQETSIGESSNVGSYDFSLTGTNANFRSFTNIVRTEYPNGWYRFSARVASNPNAGQGTFTNTSRVDLEGGFNSNYVWGIQVEPEVEFASSYIPTSGAAADRGADNASMVGDNFSSWYNQYQGTFYSEHMTGIGRTSGGRHVYSADANFQNRISAQFAFDPIENLNRFRSFVRSNGTIYGDYSPDNTAIEGVKNKTSQSYKLNKASQTLNGNSVGVTGEPSLLPSPSIFEIGKYMGSYDYLNGYVSQITYYPTAVTDTVLINLTK